MKKSMSHSLVISGLIAAQYVVLTMASAFLGLASGAVQVRMGEALTVLPCFTRAAVPGLFVGCVIANIMSGCAPWDVAFGSLATLLGASGTYAFRKNRYLAIACPILSNTIIVPFILAYVYDVGIAIPYLMLTVGAGEVISCGVLGLMLHKAIERRPMLFE